MKLIRELIEIPEQIHGGEFVLKLSEGLLDPETTLQNYVVTPELVLCFERALDLVKDATLNRRSKGAYLHGSFGAGKSHFMAVLDLLLAGNARARSIRELAPAVARHEGWIEGRKFLLVPYHLIGAESMESAILGQYSVYVRHHHPDAPTPGVFAAEHLFEDARRLREAIGNDAFLAQLNRGRAANSSGWGNLGERWTAESFDHALRAPYRSEERTRLVGDLVANIFTSIAGAGEFVPLDGGLSIVSRHARDLGYDAVVLFLDELVLWLASHAADPAFLNSEGQKVAKLVEAQSADRPVPIISFIARQRDLSKLIGENIPGAQQVAFTDILRWWEARFDTITLEDRNLPAIAEKRVLRPRSEAARLELDRAFQELAGRKEVFQTLQTTHYNTSDFRRVYPFSPALVEVLVATSSMLQRERTAIRAMMQLLVNHRDHLKVGDLIPVGDLWDVISEGVDPYNEGTRQMFDSAEKLYRTRLLPIIEAEHKFRAEEAAKLPWDDPKARAFRSSDRIIKTLLLAAIVPELECFRELTAARLAALNHGSIRTPIPGDEARETLTRLRRWAAQRGEIRISEATDPIISLQLSGIDTHSIIERARSEDTQGNRRRKLRELIFAELGIPLEDKLFIQHTFTWRGTKRMCDVVFGHIAEMQEDTTRARDVWRVLIDLPIPPEGSELGPTDARAALELLQVPEKSTNTIAWIPAHFTLQARNDLGKLVILERILTGDRLDHHTPDLSAADRAQARSILENQRNSLTEQMKALLTAAYGASADPAGLIDSSFPVEDRVQSLNVGLGLRLPVGGSLRNGFENLLEQALRYQFPAHPDFKIGPTRNTVRTVWAEIERALAASEPSILIEKGQLRVLMKDIAVPLRLGIMGEDRFALERDFWRTHFNRSIETARRESPEAAITVKNLREWIDSPPMVWGLPVEVQNLLILTFAGLENYSFVEFGGPAEASTDSLKNEWKLRSVSLPSPTDWEEARRASTIFGEASPQMLNAANVDSLAGKIVTRAEISRVACDLYHKSLQLHLEKLGIDPDSASRMKTATATLTLAQALTSARGAAAIAALAHVEIATSAEAMGTSFRKSADLHAVLEHIRWELFDVLSRIDDERTGGAKAVLANLKEALENDELAVGLAARITQLESDAIKLLEPKARKTETSGNGAKRDETVLSEVAESMTRRNLSLTDAKQVFREIEERLQTQKDARVDLTWTLHKSESH
jgi:hypothetical protein